MFILIKTRKSGQLLHQSGGQEAGGSPHQMGIHFRLLHSVLVTPQVTLSDDGWQNAEANLSPFVNSFVDKSSSPRGTYKLWTPPSRNGAQGFVVKCNQFPSPSQNTEILHIMQTAPYYRWPQILHVRACLGNMPRVCMIETYLIFVTDTPDGVCVKKIARCKFLPI